MQPTQQSPPSRQLIPDLDPYFQRVFESLRNPLETPFCHMTYYFAICTFYPHMSRANETTNLTVQEVAKSLILFYAQPIDNVHHTKLEGRLFHQPCRCLALSPPSLLPQLAQFHSGLIGAFQMRTGSLEVTSLDALVILIAELTDRLISITQVSASGDVRAWRRRMAHLVQKLATDLATSFSYWLCRDLEDAQVFALFGTLLDLHPDWLNAVDMHPACLRSAVECMHKLVDSEHKAKPQLHSPRIDLIFHGAGCFAEANCFFGDLRAPAKSSRFRTRFAQTQIYEDICLLLSMISTANDDIKTGKLMDVVRLGGFGADLHDFLNLKGPISPLIKQAKARIPDMPNGWGMFDTYFHIMDRCSNHLRHSTLKEAGFPKLPTFELAYKERVKHGERMMACSGCKASHYCSKECQLESWKAQPMPHRKFCPVLKKIFQVHESIQHTAMSGRTDFSGLYQSSGISTKDIGETIEYVITLMEHFSEYKD